MEYGGFRVRIDEALPSRVFEGIEGVEFHPAFIQRSVRELL